MFQRSRSITYLRQQGVVLLCLEEVMFILSQREFKIGGPVLAISNPQYLLFKYILKERWLYYGLWSAATKSNPNNQCDAMIRKSQELRWKTRYTSFCSSSLKQLLHVHLSWHSKHNGWYMDHVSVVLLWFDPPLSFLSIPSTLSWHTPTVQSMGMWSHSMLMILPWSRLEKHIRYKWHLKSIDKSDWGGRGHRERLLFVFKEYVLFYFFYLIKQLLGLKWAERSPCKESFSERTICHKL